MDMHTDKPIIALLYDFDKTLCTQDMQNYTFIPSLGMETGTFWQATDRFGRREHMDGILAYMYTMVHKCQEKQIPFTREYLEKCGQDVQFFPGVTDWFRRINRFGEEQGVQVEHYIISSGLREIIEGSGISQEFKKIYASEFYYDETGRPVWPKLDVNYTAKTQYVFRINKGVLDVANDRELNASMPDDKKRVPFRNMVYIGDGLSDVPCMKMMRTYGGVAIAVWQPESRAAVEELLSHDRVDFIFPADYREGTALDATLRNIIRKMAVVAQLETEHTAQYKQLGKSGLPYQASLFE